MTKALARIAGAACLAASFALLDSASAHPLALRLTEGTVTTTITDTDGDGVVTFAGPLGPFILSVEAGVSYPASGSPADPAMTLTSLNVTGATGGTLMVELSHHDFSPHGDSLFLASLAGIATTAGSATVSYDAWLGTGNTLFAQDILIADLDFMGSGPFAASDSGTVTTTMDYSLTQVLVVTLAAGSTVSATATLELPEPATLALFALALAGLGFGGRLLRSRRD